MDDVLSAHNLHGPSGPAGSASSATSLLVIVSPLADLHQLELARIALANALGTITKDDRFKGIFDGAADYTLQATAGITELDRCRLEIVPNADRKSAIAAIERALQSETPLILFVGQTTVPFGHWMLRNGVIASNHMMTLLGSAGRPPDASRCTLITSSPCDDWRVVEKKMAASFSLMTYSFDTVANNLDTDTSHVVEELCRLIVAQSPSLCLPDPKSVCGASGKAPVGIASTSGRSASLYLFQDRGSGAVPTLLVLDGFTMLVNAGAERLPAWLAGYVRHYQRIDVVLLSHIAHNNVLGLASCVSDPGAGDHGLLVNHWLVPPPLGGGLDHSDAVCSSSNALQLDLRAALTSLVQLSKAPCCNVAVTRPKSTGSASSGGSSLGKPMLIFHKIGYGSLELLTLYPSEDDVELKKFSADWKKTKPDGHIDLNDVAAKSLPSSATVLLLWKPSNPKLPVKRVLYVGWKCASFKKMFPSIVAGLCASQDCLKQHEYVPAEGLHVTAAKKQAPHQSGTSAAAAATATPGHSARKVPPTTSGAVHADPSAPMSATSKEAAPATHKAGQATARKTDRPTTATTKTATAASAGAATQHGQQKRPQTTSTASSAAGTSTSGPSSNIKDKASTDSKKPTAHAAGKAAASSVDTKKGGAGTTKKHAGDTARPPSAQHTSRDDKKQQQPLAKTTKKEIAAKETVPAVSTVETAATATAAAIVTNGLPSAPEAEPVRDQTDHSDVEVDRAATEAAMITDMREPVAHHEEPQDAGPVAKGEASAADIDSDEDGHHSATDEAGATGKLVAIGTVECAITEHGEADFCDDTPEELSADQMRQLGLYDDEEENAIDNDSLHAATKTNVMPTANGGLQTASGLADEHLDEDRSEEDEGVEDGDDDSGHADDGTPAAAAPVPATDMSHLPMEGSFYGKDVVSMEIENEHGSLDWDQQPLALPMPARGPAVDSASASSQAKKNPLSRGAVATMHVDCLCVSADMDKDDLHCLFEAVRARHVIVQDGGAVAGDSCRVLEALLEEAERDAVNTSSGAAATAVTSVIVSTADAQVLAWIQGNSARLKGSRVDVSDIDLDHRTITVAIGNSGDDSNSEGVTSNITDGGDVTEDGHTCRGMRLDL